ncbi:hypothetical protein HHK36_030720 [Tetracentron sinense]|uniref:PHD-type zinc finger plants domain-containing protein n=1 Tax=Tetracentron sinense TaxID=13715 RepID=A0A834Y9U2_TETSI|nr:hypothetical protein HHK36_030720 [Tetracentron sinense]
MSKSKAATVITSPIVECCMCGDYGLPFELFRCKVCHFRSQHRYCSNLYPKAESCRVCNWCLINSSISSSTNNYKNKDDNKIKKKKKKKSDGHARMKVQKGKPIKKWRSPKRSSSARKKMVTDGCMEETLRSARLEEISNSKRGILTVQVFKGKVRRFKLLDEVL